MRRSNVQLAVVAAILCGLSGCDSAERERERDRQRDAQHSPAVSGVVRISAGTQKDIGLAVTKIKRQTVGETLAATGWLAARPGAEISIKAPAIGFVLPPEGKARFELGAQVNSADQVLGTLEILLSARDQAELVSAKKDADILIQQSLVTMQRCEAQLARLKDSESAVAGTRISELQEAADRARVAYQQAQEKLPFLPQEPFEGQLKLRPAPLRAAIAGRVVKVHVSPRQLVVEGDPLFSIADWSTLWIRVPVFEGDVPRVDRTATASLQVSAAKEYRGAPIDVPQAIEPGRRSLDLYYEVANAAGDLRPGQPVQVRLPLGRSRERLVVPRAAVVWDGMGNSWVYVQTDHEGFRRRRVELGPAVTGGLVVERGLDEGEPVVTVAAGTLYGQEFKSEIPVEERD